MERSAQANSSRVLDIPELLKLNFCILFLAAGFSATAGQVYRQLFINRGTFTTVSGTTFPALAFNSSPVYSSLNEVMTIGTGDTLHLTIINNDTAVHGFAVKDYGVNVTIPPSDTATVTVAGSVQRLYIYYDSYDYPNNRYLGAAGMICVLGSNPDDIFYWNIKEHQTEFNEDVASGSAVDWSQYYPDYFTINGKSFPDLQGDSTAVVTGAVGDTILIFAANTGQSAHSIHFHGFHGKAVFSTLQGQTGWEKDTYSARSMEGYILQLIPDKPGSYSVHDHNLVAVSGGGVHPNGMFIIMEFQ